MRSSIQPSLKNELLKNSQLIKENLTLHTNRKYAGTALTQNFFNMELESSDYILGSHSQTPALSRTALPQQGTPNRNPEERGRSLRRSRRKMESTVLEPMKQEDTVEIFTRSLILEETAPTPTSQQFEELAPAATQDAEQEREAEAISKLVTHKGRRRSISRKPEEFHPKVEPTPPITQNKQEVKIDLFKPSDYLFFDDKEEESDATKHEDSTADPQPPLPDLTHHFKEENSEALTQPQFSPEPQMPPEHPQNESPRKQISQTPGSQFFNFDEEGQLRQQLLELIPNDVTLRMALIRDKDGLNTFWPEFHLHFLADRKRVISAKKTSSRPSSTFLISRSRGIFDERANEYLGKVKSTTFGDVFNIFGPGPSPTDAKRSRTTPRELLATVVYNSSLFHENGPRKFAVYVMQPGVNYYKDFPQVQMYSEEVPLHLLHNHPRNKDKIYVLRNRKPKWSEALQTYQLDFRGMAVCPSVKNFILEDEATQQEVVLFAKKTETDFLLDVSGGISLYVAFSLTIASFDNRMIFQ